MSHTAATCVGCEGLDIDTCVVFLFTDIGVSRANFFIAQLFVWIVTLGEYVHTSVVVLNIYV